MPDASPRRHLAAFLAFSSVCCLLNLGGFRLTSMEPMVLDGARHMLANGQWALPHLYGELFMFKPPMAVWMSAVPLALWEHPSELLLRLPFAASGLLLGLVVFWLFGRAGGSRLGLLVAMATVGAAQFTDKVRIAQYDMPLAAGVGIAVAAAVVNLSRRRQHAGLWLLAYGSLAAGFLAKGMPALMAFLPGLLVAAVATRSFGRLLGWRHLCGAALGGLAIGGYLLWAHASGGDDAFLQPLAEARTRGLEWSPASLARTLLKPAAIWAGFLPWSLALVFWPVVRPTANRKQADMLRAALGFAVGGAVSFLLVPTFETRYHLPLVTAFGVASGVILEALYARRIDRRFVTCGRALFGLALLLVVGAAATRGVASWPLLAAGGAAAAALALGRRTAAPTGAGLVRVLAATSILCALGQALVVVPSRAHKRDFHAVAARLAARLDADEPVWLLGPADCAAKIGNLLYYLDRPTLTLADPRDAQPGSMLLLFEPPRGRPTDRLGWQVVDRISHPRYDFTLVRAERSRAGDRLAPEPAPSETTPQVGDLCRRHYVSASAKPLATGRDYDLRSAAVTRTPAATIGAM